MSTTATRGDATGQRDWLGALRRYLVFVLLANFVWEVLQLPLYTLWREGTPGEIAFAVVHCTGGDLLIALSSLAAALVVTGRPAWPRERFWPVAGVALAIGVGYTIFSEWLNLVVRASWAYSELMPVVPPFGTGLSPLLQWIVIPLAGLWWARGGRVVRHAGP
jgi:hypothetical protein